MGEKMRTKTYELTVVFAALFVFTFNIQLFAQEADANRPTDFFEMSLEQLMEVPIVYAFSKRLQPITEATSSVEIVTAEDVRRAGCFSADCRFTFRAV
jgi:hypothetical protein